MSTGPALEIIGLEGIPEVVPGDDLVAIADADAPGGGRPRRRCRGHHVEDRVQGRGTVGARGRSRGRRGGRDRAGGGPAGRPGDRRDPARVRVRERRRRCLEPGHGHAGAAAARPRRHRRAHPARTAGDARGPARGGHHGHVRSRLANGRGQRGDRLRRCAGDRGPAWPARRPGPSAGGDRRGARRRDRGRERPGDGQGRPGARGARPRCATASTGPTARPPI